MNRVFLYGRLGQDPEWKTFQNNSGVCNFSMATSEKYTDKQGQAQEKTEWHRIVVWGKLGEAVTAQMKKGSECFVMGKVSTRSWEGKDGRKQYSTEIVAERVLTGLQTPREQPRTQAQPQSSVPKPNMGGSSAPSYDDDLPF